MSLLRPFLSSNQGGRQYPEYGSGGGLRTKWKVGGLEETWLLLDPFYRCGYWGWGLSCQPTLVEPRSTLTSGQHENSWLFPTPKSNCHESYLILMLSSYLPFLCYFSLRGIMNKYNVRNKSKQIILKMKGSIPWRFTLLSDTGQVVSLSQFLHLKKKKIKILTS